MSEGEFFAAAFQFYTAGALCSICLVMAWSYAINDVEGDAAPILILVWPLAVPLFAVIAVCIAIHDVLTESSR